LPAKAGEESDIVVVAIARLTLVRYSKSEALVVCARMA
jgi:hypothetical protein